MADIKPLVSIGMFVYNGEHYIRQSIDSLLAQDYKNFEMIISDNASTDKTGDICLEYASHDKRIKYYRNDVNMGVHWNIKRVFELSCGEYFMWVSDDDYWAPSYIRKCLEVFNVSEAIVLAAAQCELIDPLTGKPVSTDLGLTTIGQNTVERFKSTATNMRPLVSMFYGIHKRNVLREAIPFEKVPAPGKIFLTKLCLRGEFATVPEKLIFRRLGGMSSNSKSYLNEENISNKLFRKYPHFGYAVTLNKIIFQTDRFTPLQKIKLALWSTNDYLRFRCICLAYRIFRAICPNAAERARELWVNRRRKNMKLI